MHLGMWELLLVALIVLLLFGSGKISGLMGDFGKGIRAFKDGLADKPSEAVTPQAQTTATQATATSAPAEPVPVAPPAQIAPPPKA